MRSLRLRMSRCSSAVGRRGGCSPGIVNHARTAHERTKIAHVHHQALTGGRGRERGRPRFGTAGVVCRSARRFSAIAAIVAGTRERVFLYNFLCIATGLAFVCRGNRAFCKCVCPATVFLRVRVDKAGKRRAHRPIFGRCFRACAWTRPPASPALCPMGLAIGDPQSDERTPRTVFSACAAWRNARKRH